MDYSFFWFPAGSAAAFFRQGDAHGGNSTFAHYHGAFLESALCFEVERL